MAQDNRYADAMTVSDLEARYAADLEDMGSSGGEDWDLDDGDIEYDDADFVLTDYQERLQELTNSAK